MQFAGRAMSWMNVWRTIAVLVVLVLGLELSLPISGYAHQSLEPPSVTGQNHQELPPMQEAATVYERKPYYKKWWFWAIVGTVVAGAVAGAAIAMSGSTQTGTVTITGPPPR